MNAEPAAGLADALRRALGPRWEHNNDGTRLEVVHRDRGSPYRSPRRVPDWAELLDGLEAAFADYGVPRAQPLPLRWGRDTDLTISAVQALDPYLKDGHPFTYRSGYLPQPVVRFTGKRDAQGELLDGFLTSFVNVSHVRPIADVNEHAAIFDEWIGVLSRLGLHARHLRVAGSQQVWRRGPVSGVTLHFSHADLPLGDHVLLWNAEHPEHLATDLGSGLERLRWTIGRSSWGQTVHGTYAGSVSPAVLDAVRTSVLLLGSGVVPSAQGAGSALRRLLRLGSNPLPGLGLFVRASYRFWSLMARPTAPWPDLLCAIERERI